MQTLQKTKLYKKIKNAEQGAVQKQLPFTRAIPFVEQTIAQRAADEYLAYEVNTALYTKDGVFIPLARPIWQFAVQFCLAKLPSPVIMATLDVDAVHGQVVPLAADQVEVLQERINALIIAYKNSNLPDFPPALRVPIPAAQVDKMTAQAAANHYLHTALGPDFVASVGVLVPTGRPVWLFDIHAQSKPNTLGVLAVNALTGVISPLTDHQIREIQERLRHVPAPSPS